MAYIGTLEIAGVNFVIHGEPSIILEENDPAYQPFFAQQAPGKEAIHLEISLELTASLLSGRLMKIFDSGQSWVMFRDNGKYVIALHLPQDKQPLWVAKMSRDLASVTVHCGEKSIRRKNGQVIVSNPIHYPLDQILLMYTLAKRRGMLLHAAGADINGRGLVFPGRSGAGKSSISRQLAVRKETTIFSDDRIVIRKIDAGFKFFGTPWPGDAGKALNRGDWLSAMFFLHHGVTDRIRPISPGEAFKKLMPVTSIPWYDKEILPEILRNCEALVSSVPAYDLYFKPTVEVVDVLEKFISG